MNSKDFLWSYQPPGPIAAKFMRSNARLKGIRGPWGSGKTTTCIMEILRRAQDQQPGPDGIRRSRVPAIRNTYPDLKMTTIKSWHDWVPKDMGRWVSMGPPTHHIQRGDVDLEMIFLALDNPDDVKKLFSLDISFSWINEAKFVPKPIIDFLTGRVGRYPAVRNGGVTWPGIIMDTNSMDEDHWWYDVAEENKVDGWEFFTQPSGLDPMAENIENLPKDYYINLMKGKSADWIKVYIENNYGYVQEGKPVWAGYSDTIHCQPTMPIPKSPITIGIDFGLTPAAIFAQRDAMGGWRVLSELVATDMGAVRFAALLSAELRGKYSGFEFEVIGDPAGDNRAQTDETTPMMILRAAGIPIRPAPTNDVVQRVEAVAVTLNRLIDGKPGFILDPSCKVLRKAMIGAYQYRRLQLGGAERYTDKPDKNQYSHVADALQYAFLGAGEGKALIRRPDDGRQRQTEAADDYNPKGRFSDGARQTQAVED